MKKLNHKMLVLILLSGVAYMHERKLSGVEVLKIYNSVRGNRKLNFV